MRDRSQEHVRVAFYSTVDKKFLACMVFTVDLSARMDYSPDITGHGVVRGSGWRERGAVSQPYSVTVPICPNR